MQICMDWRKGSFDWNQARAFLATAEAGSLSAAARALGMTQPTLGRQVAALETALGVTLFERVGRGLALTPSGVELLEHVRAMGEAANRVSLTASGQSQSLEGAVGLTATEVASAFLLPPILARMRRAQPGIHIELVATNSLRDLRRREADIALRSVRPSDPDLIARKLQDETARLYAAERYIAREGPFDSAQALNRADFLGFEDNDPFMDALNARGLSLSTRNFPILCGAHLVQWALVQEGFGVGVMATRIGDAQPGVRRVAPWMAPFAFEHWLVSHRDLRTSRRVRFVFDWLAKELGVA